MDLDDVIDNDLPEIPPQPLDPRLRASAPEITFGSRGRSDVLVAPAKKAEVIPISTGVPLTERFKVLRQQEEQLPSGSQNSTGRTVVRMLPIPKDFSLKRSSTSEEVPVPAHSSKFYAEHAKSLRQQEMSHSEQMVALQNEQRRKMLEAEQLRMGSMKVIGAKPTIRERTLMDSINPITNIVHNRIRAQTSNEIRTARSLNLRLGVPAGNGGAVTNSNQSNRSLFRVENPFFNKGGKIGGSVNPFTRGTGGINGRPANQGVLRNRDAFHDGENGLSAPMQNRQKRRRNGFDWKNNHVNKDRLDNELDKYMDEARKSRQHLDKELDKYMADAAAARANKKATRSVQSNEDAESASGMTATIADFTIGDDSTNATDFALGYEPDDDDEDFGLKIDENYTTNQTGGDYGGQEDMNNETEKDGENMEMEY